MRVVALAIGALVLAGCAGNDRAQEPADPTSDEMCEFVTPSSLKEIFRTEFEDGEPRGIDSQSGIRGTPACHYSQLEAEPPDLEVAHNPWAPYDAPIDVRVGTWRADQEADPLASYFEDVDYDEADGLGDLAGFGPVPGHYDALLVLTKLDGEDRYLEVLINQYAGSTVEQARTIAELVLGEL